MDFNICAQCGKEIEGKGIHFRNRNFCGDECCEEFEDEYQTKGEPQLADLASVDSESFDGDDLGYKETDEDLEENGILDDDDFAIDLNDF